MIKHLERLEGASNARCRKWRLVVGSDREHRRTRRYNGSYREALKALDAFAEEVCSGRVVARDVTTLAEYADAWLARLSRSGTVDVQTVDGYRWRLNAVCHVLGGERLQALTPSKLDAAYAAMMEGASVSGRKLSGTYVGDAHTTLRLMLDSAVADGLLGKNPANDAHPPKRDTPKKAALTDMELRLLAAMLPTGGACSVAVILAVTTGLRRGELCALRWQDVDLQNGTLEVARAARIDGSVKDTKTRAGHRVIPLPKITADALAEWRLCVPQAEGVICDMNGNALKPNAVTHWWLRHRHEYLCDGVTLHELRHTYITSLARAGVHPRVMQELAGHSSPRVSMDVYTHLTLEDKRAAVRSLGL